MNFYQTPARRLHILRSICCFSLAIAMLGFFLFVPTDAFGHVIELILLIVCTSGGIFQLRQARQCSRESIVYARPHDAPTEIQLQYYRRMRMASLFGFPLLALITAIELRKLESGEAGEVSILAPLAWVYNVAGFWPTIIFIVLSGISCFIIFQYKVRELSEA